MEDKKGLGLHPQGIKMKSFLYYLQIVFEMPISGKEIYKYIYIYIYMYILYIRKLEMSTT
jgi:hypothetical protein